MSEVDCPCSCHGGPGAYPPPCSVPGGCGPHEPEATCAATPGCRRRPVVGLICRAHYDRLGQILADVESEAAILSAVPSMQQRNERSGSPAFTRSPARVDVLVATDPRRGAPGLSEHSRDDPAAYDDTASILDVLHSWARVVREERHFATRTEPVTISGERGLLTRQLDWICEQPWIDEAYADLSALLGQLRAANGHRPDRPYSRCPAIVGGEHCTGDVWVQDELQPVWRRHPDRCTRTWEQAPGAAVCDTCGSSWKDEAEKARLKRMVADMAAEMARPRTEDGYPMRTAEEIMREQGLTRSAFDVKAHRLRQAGSGGVSHGGYYDPRGFEKVTA